MRPFRTARLPLRATLAALAGVSLVAAATPSRPAPDDVRTRVRYGGASKLGNGRARAYVITDAARGTPTEVGVALDEAALEGLPTSGMGHAVGHQGPDHELALPIPATAGVPFRWASLNWNVGGHEPPGVYDTPHFDFHFYTIDKAKRDARIVLANPRYAAEADRLPAEEFRPQHGLVLGPPGAKPSDVAVPLMGVHWIDVRAPELQGLLGKPERARPFTATFIYGSWDGEFIFAEPMVTRAHLLAKKDATDPAVRDQVIPVGTAARAQAAGYWPGAYRITWDAGKKEYRIALTQLTKKQ
ncbi:DUF5602 domain-containing protein [Roseisolibacter sp. H3M3-2]|uniref:DUF5602 domain-containing protein n=1 Tax=Roseisolibacter sp. H3M3-2 TaxID=3031323 RepID=UPI0023DAA881|nr:DUF5602 domain-containing protein [Roseisolibacter sp. H3M3-2]MDF1505849.1 DUF5602 domain-containing protein [Roseisolibacter sp. H3M3-2]